MNKLIILSLFVLISGFYLSDVYAQKIIRDDSTGGDCDSIGTWNASTKTCTLFGNLSEDVIGPNVSAGIEVIGDEITLDGNGFTLTGINSPQGQGGGAGIVIYGNNVVVRNFSITGTFNECISVYPAWPNYPTPNNVVIEDNTLTCSNVGIRISETNETVVQRNSAINGKYGMIIYKDFNALILDNIFSNNNLHGILVSSATSSQIENNNIESNGEHGILIHSNDAHSNTVFDNEIKNNSVGLEIRSASHDNIVYQNHFENNVQAIVTSDSNNNVFSFSNIGNNWSNFNEPSEGCFDSNFDNTCDASYSFSGSYDAYPICETCEPEPLPPIIHPSSPCTDGCGVEGNNPDLKIFASGYVENPINGITTISSVWEDPDGVVVYDAVLQVNSQGQFNNEFDNPMYVGDMRDTGMYTTTYTYDDVILEYQWSYVSYIYEEPDTIPPVVVVPNNMAIEATSNNPSPVTFSVSASDDTDGSLSPACSHNSGSNFPIGVTTVTCTATDSAGNESSESFTITVTYDESTTEPQITIDEPYFDGVWKFQIEGSGFYPDIDGQLQILDSIDWDNFMAQSISSNSISIDTSGSFTTLIVLDNDENYIPSGNYDVIVTDIEEHKFLENYLQLNDFDDDFIISDFSTTEFKVNEEKVLDVTGSIDLIPEYGTGNEWLHIYIFKDNSGNLNTSHGGTWSLNDIPDENGDFHMAINASFEQAGQYQPIFSYNRALIWGPIITVTEINEPGPEPEPDVDPNTPFQLSFDLSGMSVFRVAEDTDFQSLILYVDVSSSEGILEVSFPRDFFDSSYQNTDDDFVVLSDGDEPRFSETRTTSSSRTLTIFLPQGTEQVEIIGSDINGYVSNNFPIFASDYKEELEIESLSTRKTQYREGDTIVITGKVQTTDFNTDVTLQVFKDGNLIDVSQVSVSSDETFTHTVLAEGLLWNDSGKYTVKATYGSDVEDTSFVFRTDDSNQEPDPDSDLDYEVIIVPADGSGAPGCEETSSGCYLPEVQSVAVGGVVIMKNTDTAAHTYTSGTPDSGPDGIFDTSLLMAGGSFEWSPDTKGVYPYFCMVHPWMIGTILVGEGTSIPPTPEPELGDHVDLEITVENRVYDINTVAVLDISIEDNTKSQDISLDITDPRGTTVVSRSVSLGPNESISYEFKIDENAKTGNYKATVTTSDGNRTEKDTAHFKVKSQFNSFKIDSVSVTDQKGNPSDLEAGETGFIKVNISSNKSIATLLTVNIFDSELTSIGIGSVQTTLASGDSEIILSFNIPDDAAIGPADIYVNAFSDWPSEGGVPLTGEVSAVEDIE